MLSQRQKFIEDITEHLHGEYLLETGEIVKGASTSHAKQWVRDCNSSGRRWRNLGNDSRFEDLCEKVGLQVRRGRTRRVYHGGKTGWGVPCDVITAMKPVQMFDVFDKDGIKINEAPLVQSDAAHEVACHSQDLFDVVLFCGEYRVNGSDFIDGVGPRAQVARFHF